MNKGRFLVVEDEFVVAENLRKEIELMGHDVVGIASSGNDALTIAEREKPDMVLMDIHLLGPINGVETAVQMRRNWNIPSLFITAFADEKYLDRAKLADPLGYLVKPFEQRGLRAGVEMALFKSRMEHLLIESESRFRTMFENVPVAYLALDATGRCMDMNPESGILLGVDRDAPAGRNITDFLAETAKGPFSRELQRLLTDGHLQAETLLVHQNGLQRMVRMECRVQKGIHGDFIQAHCILHDITEQKRVEAQRLQFEQQLQQAQKAESLARMASAIAHHFNNQLQVVTGNLEMSLLDLKANSELSFNLDQALKAANKAAEVSSLLLTYRGQSAGKRNSVNLSEICRKSLLLHRSVVPEHIELEADLPADGTVVHADTAQIQQILSNLITNAREAAEGKSEIISLSLKTVSGTEIPARHRYPVEWQPEPIPYACIEVKDTGSGIAEKDIQNLFDPFFTRKFTGRGLGLSVVLGLVRVHGGGIVVESKPETGSRFKVFFPILAEKMPAISENRLDAPKPCECGTVLVVDDDAQIRVMIRMMLTRLGLNVIEASNGAEAVEIFRRQQDRIQCILSDLTMPRMNGWETLAAIRKLSPDLPVILSSGYDEAHVMENTRSERPDAFLGKPYRFHELQQVMHQVLRIAGPAR